VVQHTAALRGLRPVAPYQTKYEWSYLYSALEGFVGCLNKNDQVIAA